MRLPTIYRATSLNDAFRCSAVQVTPDRTLQARADLTHGGAQTLQVVGGSNAKSAHEVARGRLHVTVAGAAVTAVLGQVVLGPAEVGVAGDAGRALEALQARLGLGLRVRVEGALAEELVRRDALLIAELLPRVLLVVACGRISVSTCVARAGSAKVNERWTNSLPRVSSLQRHQSQVSSVPARSI